MTDLEALVALNMVGDIGSARLGRLSEFFGKPENILKAPAEKLTAVSGIGPGLAAKIRALKKEDIDNEFSCAKKLGLEILTQVDPDYPENLKVIPGSPIVLYVKGKFGPEDKYSIAIVGSRRASFYGLNNAQKFAFELSAMGFVVVSGMARGVDTCAHRGALKSGGRTIAVIGSGFNNIYPAENKELAEEIACCGAVVSEFPVNEPPKRENFPRRNRIISGLSLGTLVAEAAKNSGALITADFALEQGREVFALPGKIDSGNAFGANELIKQGAKLVTRPEEIAEEFIVLQKTQTLPSLNRLFRSRHCEEPPEAVTKPACPAGRQSQNRVCFAPAGLAMTAKESGIYRLISKDSIFLEELVEKTNMAIPEISDILLRLQMKHLIRQLPGKQFVRS